MLRATTACTFSTSELPKVVRHWCVLYILTSKCASRHNGVHFFDIATSKSDPTMVCFAHFDFKMCFAPQRRALFRHLNFQKWSAPLVFCPFWLGNVLRTTTACTFSTSHLASWLRTRRFSEPTFRPSGATNHWKNSESRLSYLFAHLHLLSSDLVSSDSSHLCFSTVHIVGSFTSKLPSISFMSFKNLHAWHFIAISVKQQCHQMSPIFANHTDSGLVQQSLMRTFVCKTFIPPAMLKAHSKDFAYSVNRGKGQFSICRRFTMIYLYNPTIYTYIL